MKYLIAQLELVDGCPCEICKDNRKKKTKLVDG